ncbi:MAG: hypothetical protein M0Q92_15445 [Methanoregula sp.]|jgi:L-lysine 2,3-aminomutase|nr:hypothetical protein [Methanoregula sp.]
MTLKYITSISELDNLVGLAPKEREMMETVTEKFPFRSNEYYISIIDWKGTHDPIRRIVVPDSREIKNGGLADPSCEQYYTQKPGLQHKYDQTGLSLLTDVCAGICRFCFRKRLFLSSEQEMVNDVSENIEYIREHEEITNVLLTGGNPRMPETRQLEPVLRELRELLHANFVRIGSKVLAYTPYRVIMSYVTGTIWMAGRTTKPVFMRYPPAADPADAGKDMVCRPNPKAQWFYDYYDQLTDFRPKKVWLS